MSDLIFDLGPTQSRFVHSNAEINLFVGPMGEGKTYAGLIGLIAHAARCGKPIRSALIRDTHQNIKISTVPDISEVLGDLVTFHDDYKKMVIHCSPKIDCDLFGIDDPASLSKLQGPQYACIWLEEPAPIVEKANAGISYDVFALAVARASRQKGTKMRVQITQNPADEDHWTAALANAPEIYAEDTELGIQIRKKTFRVPYGENRHLNAHTRIANKAAFQSDEGKYARYVEGREAPVQKGKRVFKNYNPKVHFSDEELPVIEGAIGVRGWDAWHHPACVVCQLVPPNRLVIHDVLFEEGIGTKEMINEHLIPLLNRPKYKGMGADWKSGKIKDWRDIGDPTMRTPDQSSTNQSAAKVLEGLLDTRFEPGPTRWQHRFDPTHTALSSIATNGQPRIILSKTAYDLHRSLNGGWHWKVDNSGNIVGSLPVNDNYADIGNAFCYPVSVIFPNKPLKKSKPVDKAKLKRAVQSYATRPQKRRVAAHG